MSDTQVLESRLEAALGKDPQATAALALLLDRDARDRPLFEAREDARVEERAALIELFGRLGLEGSSLLMRRAYAGREPLFSSRFADVAVAASLREASLDAEVAVALIRRGLDVQAAVILRHLWELNLRALVVAIDPIISAEWERATLAALEGGTSSKRLERLRERAWGRGLNVGELIRQAARIEVSVETGHAAGEDPAVAVMTEIEGRTKHMRAIYFGFLSDLAHGGSQMLLRSTMRTDRAEAPADPLAAVGRPSDWSDDLLGHTLWLQERFWCSFLPSAAPLDRTDITSEERRLFLAAGALDRVVRGEYSALLWSGEDWTEAGPFE